MLSFNRSINVWDLRKTYLQSTDKPIPVYQLPSPKKNCLYGYTQMVIDKNGTKLFANSLGHNIYCYNISAYSKTPGIYPRFTMVLFEDNFDTYINYSVTSI